MEGLLHGRDCQGLLQRRFRQRQPRKSGADLSLRGKAMVIKYRVTPGVDKTRLGTSKTFFRFKTQGFKSCTVKFIITKVYLLSQFTKVLLAQLELKTH